MSLSLSRSCRELPNFSHVKAICFDVDGTVCADEGIDAIGEFCGKGEFVRKKTIEAMEGKITIEESLKNQLDAIELTRCKLDKFLAAYPLKITKGIERLFKSLRENCIEIYLVSGGFFELVKRVADHLKVPEDHVFANRLLFDKYGKVKGFDSSQPTSHAKGKSEVVASLKSKLGQHVGILMVGDGATDAEASPPADAFIGFGGVYERKPVKARADYYFYTFDDMHHFFEETGLIRPTDSLAA